MFTTLETILIILGIIILLLVIARLLLKCHRSPAPALIGRFLDSDLRRKMQPPDKIIEYSGIKEGMTALEVGCGSGAFTTFVARAVGEKGKVYALDIQPSMLKQLENKLSKSENKDINNIETINSSAYELPFDDNSIDLVYMITVLQEIPDRNKALQQARRVLKPGGILAVTELFQDPDYAWKSTTIKLGEKAGLILDKVSGSFFNYTVRFKKQ